MLAASKGADADPSATRWVDVCAGLAITQPAKKAFRSLQKAQWYRSSPLGLGNTLSACVHGAGEAAHGLKIEFVILLPIENTCVCPKFHIFVNSRGGHQDTLHTYSITRKQT